MPSRRFPHPLLPVLSGGLLALPLLAPFAAERGAATTAALVRSAFSAVCHQLPERSFALFGHQVAVCHRCLGLYAGGFAGFLLLPFLPRLLGWLIERPRRLAWFVAPLLLDVVSPFDTWWSRFGTGWIAAFPVAAILWVAWEEIFSPREGPAREAATG